MGDSGVARAGPTESRRVHRVTPRAIPENSWKYRRRFVFCVTFLTLGLEALAIILKAPSGVSYALAAVVFWMATLYLVAPTSEHVARILSLRDVMNTALNKGTTYGEVMSVPPDEVG